MDKGRLEARRKDFKKNFDDPRRRREDHAVQIRKAQREAQVQQKRQQPYLPTSAAPQQPVDLTAAVAGINSNDSQQNLHAAQQLRRLLAVDQSPPIQPVIDTGIVPRLAALLRDGSRPELQLEVAWTLTNIASGTPLQTKTITENGCIPIFVELLSSPRDEVRDQAVWALGNIAGDSPACRDMVLQCGGLAPLLKQLKRNEKTNMIRNATWALSNLCRGSPGPQFSFIKTALPTLKTLIHCADVEILIDSCWAVSYLVDTKDHAQIDCIVNAGFCPRIVELILHPNPLIQNPALRSAGQIIAGTHEQTEIMVQAGALMPLLTLLSSPRAPTRKEACWVISNIAAGTPSQIQALLSVGAMEPLIRLLETAEFSVKREAAWAVSNSVIGGNREQIEYIVKCGCVKPLCDLLELPEENMVVVALEALENILRVGQEKKELQLLAENPYVALVEEAEGFNKLENLQYTDATKPVYQLTIRIITTYFSVDEADDFQEGDHVPNLGGNPLGGFGTNVSIPQAGFDFGAVTGGGFGN